MRSTRLLLTAFLLSSTFALTSLAEEPESAASDLALEEVLESYYRAIGGRELIDSIRTVKVSGSRIEHRRAVQRGGEHVDGEVAVPFQQSYKRPDKLRTEFTYDGRTGIQAYDGETAWMVWPFMKPTEGPTEPAPMPEEMAERFKQQADFFGHLVDFERKGYEVALLGDDRRAGRPVLKLAVTLTTGDTLYYYLDSETFLPVAQEARIDEGDMTTVYGDYREVGGLLLAHVADVELRNGAVIQNIRVVHDEIELNRELEDERFSMPAETPDDPPDPPSER